MRLCGFDQINQHPLAGNQLLKHAIGRLRSAMCLLTRPGQLRVGQHSGVGLHCVPAKLLNCFVVNGQRPPFFNFCVKLFACEVLPENTPQEQQSQSVGLLFV